MSFHSYFIRMEGRDSHFGSTLLVDRKSLAADFQHLEGDLFIVFFKTQVHLSSQQTLQFKRKGETATVLFPVLSKYNQRKLKKWSELFSSLPHCRLPDILVPVLQIDKFLEVQSVAPFFGMERSQAQEMLLEMEVERKIKLIDVQHLLVTAYPHYQEIYEQLAAFLKQVYEKREKSVPLSEIEKKIKVPQSSLFFKYLLKSFQAQYDFKLAKNKLMMQKLPISETEMNRMAEITRALRHERLEVFSFDQILRATGMGFAEIHDSLYSMLSAGQIAQLDERNFAFCEALQRILNRLKKYKRNQGDVITIDAFRSLCGLSRKYVIILFEYFDREQYTQRLGSKRKILLSV